MHLSANRERATSVTLISSSISQCTSPIRTSLQPATGYRKPLFKFGKPKVLPPIVPTCSESTALCEHSLGSCTSLQENENSNDSVFSSACPPIEAIPIPSATVEAVNFVSTVERDTCPATDIIIDSSASLTRVSEKLAKKINGKCYTDDHVTPMIAWIYTGLGFPLEICPFRFSKYNPHIDWGPLPLL